MKSVYVDAITAAEEVRERDLSTEWHHRSYEYWSRVFEILT
jgi:hypothetical protein